MGGALPSTAASAQAAGGGFQVSSAGAMGWTPTSQTGLGSTGVPHPAPPCILPRWGSFVPKAVLPGPEAMGHPGSPICPFRVCKVESLGSSFIPVTCSTGGQQQGPRLSPWFRFLLQYQDRDSSRGHTLAGLGTPGSNPAELHVAVLLPEVNRFMYLRAGTG